MPTLSPNKRTLHFEFRADSMSGPASNVPTTIPPATISSIDNPGAEDGISGWTDYGNNIDTVIASTDYAHSGSHSFRLQPYPSFVPSDNFGSFYSDQGTSSDYGLALPCSSGGVRLSAYLRVSPGFTARGLAAARFVNSFGHFLDIGYGFVEGVNNASWTFVTVDLVAPEGTAAVALEFGVYDATRNLVSTDYVYVDDIACVGVQMPGPADSIFDDVTVDVKWKTESSELDLGSYTSYPASPYSDSPWKTVNIDVTGQIPKLQGKLEISKYLTTPAPMPPGFSGIVGWTRYDLFSVPPEDPNFTYGLVDDRLRSLGPNDTFENSGIYKDIGSSACDFTFTYYRTSDSRLRVFFAMDPDTCVGYCYMPWRSGAATITRYNYRGEIKEYYDGFGVPQEQPPSGTHIRIKNNGFGVISVYWNDVLKQTAVDPNGSSDPVVGTYIGLNMGLFSNSGEEIYWDFSSVAMPNADNLHIRNVWITDSSESVLTNPGAENGTSGYISDFWTIETTNTVSRSGEYAFKITDTNPITISTAFYTDQTLPVTPGIVYASQAYACTAGWEGDALLTMRFYDTAGYSVGFVVSDRVVVNGDGWNEINLSAVCPDDAVRVRLGYDMDRDDRGTLPGPLTSYWDDLSFGMAPRDYGQYPKGFPYTADIEDGMLGSTPILNDGGTLPDAAYYAEQGIGNKFDYPSVAETFDGVVFTDALGIPGYPAFESLNWTSGPQWVVRNMSGSNYYIDVLITKLDDNGSIVTNPAIGLYPNPYIVNYPLERYDPDNGFFPSTVFGIHQADVGTEEELIEFKIVNHSDPSQVLARWSYSGGEAIFSRQYSMRELAVVTQSPLTWYFGLLTAPPLRQRHRDDGLGSDLRHQRGQGSSQQVSLRRGSKAYY